MINCCYGCVAPKRFPGCHGTCPEYLAEKEEHDRIKAQRDRERDITGAIVGDQMRKVYRAMKNRRHKNI
jgi:hypothetical protein